MYLKIHCLMCAGLVIQLLFAGIPRPIPWLSGTGRSLPSVHGDTLIPPPRILFVAADESKRFSYDFFSFFFFFVIYHTVFTLSVGTPWLFTILDIILNKCRPWSGVAWIWTVCSGLYVPALGCYGNLFFFFFFFFAFYGRISYMYFVICK